MRYFSILVAASLLICGCDSEPTTLREEAEMAQENLADAREEAAEIVAESEEDAVEMVADARQDAQQEVADAQGEATAMIQNAKQDLDRKMQQLESTETIVSEEPIPTDESSDPETSIDG